MVSVLLRREDTEGRREEVYGKRFVFNTAKGQGMPRATKCWKKKIKNSPQSFQKEHGPANTLIGILTYRDVRKYISVVVSLPVQDNLLWQLQETNTPLGRCFWIGAITHTAHEEEAGNQGQHNTQPALLPLSELPVVPPTGPTASETELKRAPVGWSKEARLWNTEQKSGFWRVNRDYWVQQ